MRLLLDVMYGLLCWMRLTPPFSLAEPYRPARDKNCNMALTENGVLQVLNLPGYSSYGPAGFEAVRAQLDQLCQDTDHKFWPCNMTLLDISKIDWSRVMGHNQITDVYLLALAVAHGGALATLDHRVALNAVRDAQGKHLQLLQPI